MSNSPKMECLDNYILKYNIVTGKVKTNYDWFLFEQNISNFKNKLINEILENRVILGENFNKYLEFASHRIKNETNFFIEDYIIEGWIVKYNLQDFDFSPKNNEDLKSTLHNFGARLDLIDDEIVLNKVKHSDYGIFEFHLSCIEIINLIKKYLDQNVTDTDYKGEAWFKVGELFASGKMEKYYYVNELGNTVFNDCYSAPKVAKDLGNQRLEKVILATINNYEKEKSNKNIFNDLDKMNKILLNCKENNIEVIPYFLSRIPSE